MTTRTIANMVAVAYRASEPCKTEDFMPHDWIGRKKNKRKIDRKSIEDFKQFAQRYAK